MQPWIKVVVVVVWLAVGSTTLGALAASQAQAPSPSKKPSVIDRVKSKVKKAVRRPTKRSPTPPKVAAPTPPATPSPPPRRNYPDFLKCSWHGHRSLPDLAGKLETLKALGVNAICLMVTLPQVDPVKLPAEVEENFERRFREMLTSLKQSGFALFLVPDAPGSTAEVWEALGRSTPDEFLRTAESEAIKWAKVAEAYDVEYFAPHNELLSRLDGPPAWFGETEAERQRLTEATNRFHREILPKVRAVFSGRVIAKQGTLKSDLTAEGYDYLGLTVGHGLVTDRDRFRADVKSQYELARELARSKTLGWLVSELYLPYEERGGGINAEYEARRGQLRELQDDYFTIAIEELERLPAGEQPKGFLPVGYGPEAFNRVDEPARTVIEAFFQRR